MTALSDHALLASHAATTWALVGLIWTVQLVHYPLFACVGTAEFSRFHAGHTRRITWLVAPLMLAEAALAAWLLVRPPVGVPAFAPILGAALVVALWATTALVQVPLHGRLARGRDARAHARLVRTNWARTGVWSARGLLAIWMWTGAA